MSSAACAREREVVSAVLSGRWADGLASHASGCPECAEIAALAGAFARARNDSTRRAPVPDAGLVWWRMQLRAKREAETKAVRAVSRAQVLVLAGALVTGAAALAAGPLGEAALHASWGLPLLVAGAAWIALGPVAVWLAVADD